MKNIKLIASDMDHTLLREDSSLPPHFDATLAALKTTGIYFVAASGRPYATLKRMFPAELDSMGFVCDNGAMICYQGEILYDSLMTRQNFSELEHFTKQFTDMAIYPVFSGRNGAYLTRRGKTYHAFVNHFYYQLDYYNDWHEITAPLNKYTLYFPNEDLELFLPALEKRFGDRFNIVVSDKMWIDITNKGADKGTALARLGKRWNISANEMMVFGDNFNDISMLEYAHYSYVMENAPQAMHRYGRFTAPSNQEAGVIQVIDTEILDPLRVD